MARSTSPLFPPDALCNRPSRYRNLRARRLKSLNLPSDGEHHKPPTEATIVSQMPGQLGACACASAQSGIFGRTEEAHEELLEEAATPRSKSDSIVVCNKADTALATDAGVGVSTTKIQRPTSTSFLHRSGANLRVSFYRSLRARGQISLQLPSDGYPNEQHYELPVEVRDISQTPGQPGVRAFTSLDSGKTEEAQEELLEEVATLCLRQADGMCCDAVQDADADHHFCTDSIIAVDDPDSVCSEL
jgi:hypothetical protein